MARARNIKPSIMDNEDLAELDPLDRLLFVYLWMLADREGRLEDRPKRIAKQALSYDRDADADEILQRLADGGFLKRYSVNGTPYLQIVNFLKHQTPHGTEKDSVIPDEAGFLTVHQRAKNGYATGEVQLVPTSSTVIEAAVAKGYNSALTVKGTSPPPPVNSEATGSEGPADGGQNTLIPDSLIPDSNTPHTPHGGRQRQASPTAHDPPGFVLFWAAYPRKKGRIAAVKAWAKIAPDEALQTVILGALASQRPHLDFRENGRFIPHPATWLNEGRWDDEISLVGAAKPTEKPQWEGAR